MAKLAEALTGHAARAGSQVAMSDGRRSLTWEELAALVAGTAQDLGPGRETVGIFGENSVEWAVAFLAASVAGKTIVPIPAFFSEGQRGHLIRDAGISRVILPDAESQESYRAATPAYCLRKVEAPHFPAQESDGGLIIYTSGSTGNPKGVRLCSGQALWSAETLAKAIGASSRDRYLSVLPLPLLLELICGIVIPVLVGGSVHYDGAVAHNVGIGTASNIAESFARAKPTTSVLVPQLLALYAGQLAATGARPPAELRFVAVGGAAVPPALAASARQLGIPVYEGYGLSECASVVAVNTPGACREGTVGKPLPGLSVVIEDGEIVAGGPTVMDGYLHGEAAPRRWRTGDAGSLDADGYLTVYGRLDNLIVTPFGRNLSPEWIETLLLGDPRIGACVLCLAGDPARLTVLLIPSALGAAWFEAAQQDKIASLISRGCEAAPDYARPQRAAILSREEAAALGLFTPNGRPRRVEIRNYLQAAATFEVQA
jgi:long-subunit acyl-CoA synthetase (AMP-forming)